MVNRRRLIGGIAIAGMFGLAALLVGCNAQTLTNDGTRVPDPFDAVQNIDLEPRFPAPAGAVHSGGRAMRSMTFFGQDVTPIKEPSPGATQAPNGEGYELNFQDAPVTTVAKVIIGDILGTGYTVDPRVQGTVTLSSGRPIPRSDLLFVLEGALRTSNAVLVPDGAGYRIIAAGDAAGSATVRAASQGEAGYGITAVPLRFTSAQTMLKLLDSFALRAGGARVDEGHNMIIVQGSGPERRAALQTILSFDADWMRGQSVGVYPLESAAPEALISELQKVMQNGDGGLNHGLIEFQPIGRLNAILVVTKRSRLLRSAATWIKRLDRSNTAASGVRVYRLRYASAKEVAKLLNDVFGKSSGGTLESPKNQIAPGAGIISTSSQNSPASPFGTRGSTSLGAGTTGRTGIAGVGGAAGTSSTFSQGQDRLAGASSGTGDQSDSGQSTSLALPGVRITADITNNSLLIFANQENYRLIEQTIQQIDRQQLQVAIHVTIAEVTLNNQLQYGVQSFLKSHDLRLGEDNGSSLLTLATQSAISRVLPGYNLLLGPEADPRAILNALRSITDVKVLSTPSVVVMDNQVASLQVGDEVPIATQSASILTNPNTPLVNTIDYRNTGIILNVLPRVNANGNVILNIEQEISNVVQNATTNTLTPTVSQRKIKSSIAVATGQSVLLAGLISDRQERGRSGIPVLEELPVIGEAFSQNTRTTQRTELIMFIQPQIIRNSVDAYKVAEELRTKLRGSVEAAFPPGPSLHRLLNTQH